MGQLRGAPGEQADRDRDEGQRRQGVPRVVEDRDRQDDDVRHDEERDRELDLSSGGEESDDPEDRQAGDDRSEPIDDGLDLDADTVDRAGPSQGGVHLRRICRSLLAEPVRDFTRREDHCRRRGHECQHANHRHQPRYR
jgi:hypothetical protein